MDDIPLSLLLVALVVLLALSAFFSSSETALMALNRYRLKHLAQKGHRGAKLAADLLAKTDKLLGVILLGNNLINSAAATLVTVVSIRMLGKDNDYALTIGTLLVTFAILVFSEVTPKVLGARYSEKVAFPASYILTPLLKLVYPIVWFVNLFVYGILWILRIPTKKQNENKLTLEELRALVLDSGHFMPRRHQSMVLNLLELENITVDDIMVPRQQIEAIDMSDHEDEIIKKLRNSYHTRLPVYDDQLDNLIGIVHLKKLFHIDNEAFSKTLLKEVMREPYFIPSGTPLFKQMQLFQETKRRQGIVVDEYGEIKGLISLEDILEEIVGEFTTHAPSYPVHFHRHEDGSIVVEGSTLLRDINRKLNMDLPLDGPKTLNGLITEFFQDIPEAGMTIKIADYPIEIIQTQDRAVKVVRIYPKWDKK